MIGLSVSGRTAGNRWNPAKFTAVPSAAAASSSGIRVSPSGSYTLLVSKTGSIGHGSDGPPPWSEAKVYLISDDASFFNELKGPIGELGCEFLLFPVNSDLPSLVSIAKPNMVILDGTQIGDTSSMADRIKNSAPKTKVLILTDYDPVVKTPTAVATKSVDCYLQKSEAVSSLKLSIPLFISQQLLEIENDRAREIARRQEEQADVGRGAAAIAHNNNNHLLAVSLAIEGLDRVINSALAGRKDDKAVRMAKMVKRYRDEIEMHLGQMRETNRTMLDFNRENGARSLFSINEVISGTATLLTGDIRGKDLELELQLDQENPEFYGERRQLISIIYNLIKNACQAVSQGGKVTLVTKKLENVSMVAVGDNGPGIPPDVLPHIFEYTFTTKPEGEGTGLGLYSVRESLKKMGGEISVSTKPGLTAFTIKLPNKSPEL